MKATLHWVSAAHAVDAEVRLYDRLFTVEEPGKLEDFRTALNPASLEVVRDAKVEPSAAAAAAGTRFQFERLGYFSVDPDSTPGRAGIQPHGDAEGCLGPDGEDTSRKLKSWKPGAGSRKPEAGSRKPDS